MSNAIMSNAIMYSLMPSPCIDRVIAYITLEGESWREINYEIMCASPDPSELPMPPRNWLKKEIVDDLSLLDEATETALEHYWKGQVKACQYAIFHMC